MDVPIMKPTNGTTRALNEVTIRARVKGFLREKHFEEGSKVKKDQLLLVIDEEPFQVKVAEAKAVLEEANAALKKARESKSREVAKAQEALGQTQLQLDRVEERRERNLLARRAASQEDYDRARAKVDRSAAQVDADKASLEQATADYDINILSAQAKIDQAKADLASAQIDLGYCRMYSPIDGRIGELQVKLGNLVGPAAGSSDTTSLVSVVQLDPMGVDIRPASRFLDVVTRLVRSGLDVKLRVEGQKPHKYTGKVFFVDNTVEPTTSTVLVKAAVPNPEETILPGEYVTVVVNIGNYAGAIVIPEQAVVEAQEGARVLVVDDQHRVQMAVVKPLDLYRGLVVLESGVVEGQQVIVKGVQLARPGQEVKLDEAELEGFIKPEQAAEAPGPFSSPLLRPRGTEGGHTKLRPEGKQKEPAPSQPPPGRQTPEEPTSKQVPSRGG
jgi:RND family efflux transporter MFP subunit